LRKFFLDSTRIDISRRPVMTPPTIAATWEEPAFVATGVEVDVEVGILLVD
jgi:hypothetical protein